MTKKKYFYTYDEYSQDTRSYEIESDVKLTKSEVQDLALGCTMEEGSTNTDKNSKATFKGTDYGDDAQVEYAGDFEDDSEGYIGFRENN